VDAEPHSGRCGPTDRLLRGGATNRTEALRRLSQRRRRGMERASTCPVGPSNHRENGSDFKLYIKKTLRIHENHNRTHFSYFYRRMALGRSAGDMRAPSRRASLSPTQEEAQRRQQRKRLPLEDSSQHSKTKLHSPQRGKVQDKWQQVSVMQGIVRLARKIPESWGLSR
jgi:hypothetical protein